MKETTNPNPSPTGKKFGFVTLGTPEGTRLHFLPQPWEKIKDRLGLALAGGAHPRRILSFESLSQYMNKGRSGHVSTASFIGTPAHSIIEPFTSFRLTVRNVIIVGQNRDLVTKKLKVQVDNWIKAKGRNVLAMSGVKVYLCSLTDFAKGQVTYYYDMMSDEPVCRFKKPKKEV